MSNTSPSPATVISVGYGARSLNTFLQELVTNEVEMVVDVRLTASSRKRGFSKTALRSALSAESIGYRHERELGNPKDNREPFRQGKPWALERYDRHLGNGAHPTFKAVAQLALDQRIALLCVEHDHRTCHRSRITDRLGEEYPEIRVVII